MVCARPQDPDRQCARAWAAAGRVHPERQSGTNMCCAKRVPTQPGQQQESCHIQSDALLVRGRRPQGLAAAQPPPLQRRPIVAIFCRSVARLALSLQKPALPRSPCCHGGLDSEPSTRQARWRVRCCSHGQRQLSWVLFLRRRELPLKMCPTQASAAFPKALASRQATFRQGGAASRGRAAPRRARRRARRGALPPPAWRPWRPNVEVGSRSV